MAESTTPTTSKALILDRAQPSLAPGSYVVSVKQSLATVQEDAGKIPGGTELAVSRSFTVGGPRYALDPDDVVSVFPTDGSLGPHQATLPHVVLRRATLPWERTTSLGGGDGVPWLALLLFDAEEAPPCRAAKLSDLRAGGKRGWLAAGHLHHVVADGERGWLADDGTETAGDDVTLIDVPRSLLSAQIPSAAELRLLAHVRRPAGPRGDAAGEPVAVVIGRRLPRAGGTSVVHLVSLDRRNAADIARSGSGPVELVSLKHWTFACSSASRALPEVLQGLDRSSTWLRLPPTPAAGAGKAATDAAEAWLRRGHVPLSHRLRTGGSTVSFYRGPLSPDPNEIDLPLPVRDSDALLCLDPQTGLLDVSYAAAWELGRLLALESRDFASAYGPYRRSLMRAARTRARAPSLPVLPLRTRALTRAAPLPAVVKARIEEWRALRGVPFRYLVPDERMLPAESIRFFRVDGSWMRALLDGCGSLGRTREAGGPGDAGAGPDEELLSFPYDQATGFLLRSEALVRWPALQVAARDAGGKTLPPLRLERVSPSVLLGLFKAPIGLVELTLAPEGLPFGFEPGAGGRLVKKRRDAGDAAAAVEVPVGSDRVVDVGRLAKSLGCEGDPSGFAAQMLADTPIVRFQLAGEGA